MFPPSKVSLYKVAIYCEKCQIVDGYSKLFVTGFWKTHQNVTLGLFHFIGPANAYTHTLHILTAIIRLG